MRRADIRKHISTFDRFQADRVDVRKHFGGHELDYAGYGWTLTDFVEHQAMKLGFR